jgi:hypothetical protein
MIHIFEHAHNLWRRDRLREYPENVAGGQDPFELIRDHVKIRMGGHGEIGPDVTIHTCPSVTTAAAFTFAAALLGIFHNCTADSRATTTFGNTILSISDDDCGGPSAAATEFSDANLAVVTDCFATAHRGKTIFGNARLVGFSTCLATAHRGKTIFGNTSLRLEHAPCDAASQRGRWIFGNTHMIVVSQPEEQCATIAIQATTFNDVDIATFGTSCHSTTGARFDFPGVRLAVISTGPCKSFQYARFHFGDVDTVVPIPECIDSMSVGTFEFDDTQFGFECFRRVRAKTIFGNTTLNVPGINDCSGLAPGVFGLDDAILDARRNCAGRSQALVAFGRTDLDGLTMCQAFARPMAMFGDVPLDLIPSIICDGQARAKTIFGNALMLPGDIHDCEASARAKVIFGNAVIDTDLITRLRARRSASARWLQDTVRGQRFRIRLLRTGGIPPLITVPGCSSIAIVFKPKPLVTEIGNAFLVLQGNRTGIDLSQWGMRADSWAMHGSALVAGIGTTEAQFFDATVAEIITEVQQYLAGRPDISGPEVNGQYLTTDFVGLDIEHPFHPKNFHDEFIADESKFRNQIIPGFQKRITAAKKVLPDARIGVFFTWAGPLTGEEDEIFWNRQRVAWDIAMEQGMLDDCDFLIPQFYISYGPTDSRWGNYGNQVEFGLKWHQTITKSNGDPFAIFPWSSFRNHNGSSMHHDELILNPDYDGPALAETAVLFKDICLEKQVEYYGWWDADDPLDDPNPFGWTKPDYFDVIFP